MKALYWLKAIGVGLAGLVGIRLEDAPRYEVLERDGAIELRRYRAHVVATTRSAGTLDAASREGFDRIAAYLFGANERRELIAMSSPLTLDPAEPGWTLTLPLPVEDATRAPRPDGAISITPVAPFTAAAIVFPGRADGEAMMRHESRLRAWLADRALQSRGAARIARFDSPFTPPFLRRNEVLVDVVEA